MPHSTDQRTTSDGEEFLRLRKMRKSAPLPADRTKALALMIALGVHTTNPLVKDRVTDFLLSEERVLADLGPPAESAIRSNAR
jgi:hypothetical protein